MTDHMGGCGQIYTVIQTPMRTTFVVTSGSAQQLSRENQLVTARQNRFQRAFLMIVTDRVLYHPEG